MLVLQERLKVPKRHYALLAGKGGVCCLLLSAVAPRLPKTDEFKYLRGHALSLRVWLLLLRPAFLARLDVLRREGRQVLPRGGPLRHVCHLDVPQLTHCMQRERRRLRIPELVGCRLAGMGLLAGLSSVFQRCLLHSKGLLPLIIKRHQVTLSQLRLLDGASVESLAKDEVRKTLLPQLRLCLASDLHLLGAGRRCCRRLGEQA